MISDVSELTRLDFNEVFRMPMAEFIGYIKFIRERERRRYLQMKKEEARMRAMYSKK